MGKTYFQTTTNDDVIRFYSLFNESNSDLAEDAGSASSSLGVFDQLPEESDCIISQ